MFSDLRESGLLRESACEPLQLVDDFVACIQLAVAQQVRCDTAARGPAVGRASAHPLNASEPTASRVAGDGQPAGAAGCDAQAVHAGVPVEHAAQALHTQHAAVRSDPALSLRVRGSPPRGPVRARFV